MHYVRFKNPCILLLNAGLSISLFFFRKVNSKLNNYGFSYIHLDFIVIVQYLSSVRQGLSPNIILHIRKLDGEGRYIVINSK